MPSCSFSKCMNHSGKEKKAFGITFHAFPKDELWRRKWQSIVRRQRQQFDWVATDNSRVCSMHFNSDDIYTTDKGLRRIKNGAVPFLENTAISPDRDDLEGERNSPNSLENVDISELDSIFETPEIVYLKRYIRKINIEKKKLATENKNLKRKNQRLKEICKALKKQSRYSRKKINE